MNRELMDFIARVDLSTKARIVSVGVDDPMFTAILKSGETIFFHGDLQQWAVERSRRGLISSESLDGAWAVVCNARKAVEEMKNPPLPPACRPRGLAEDGL